MKKMISKSFAKGIAKVPPSKSFSHRLLICSALTRKKCQIENIELSNDILATIRCLEKLGFVCNYQDNKITIYYEKKDLSDGVVLDCGESGSTLRFLIPVSLIFTSNVKLIGTEKLIARGISIYEDIFLKQKIKCIKEKTSIIIEGRLKPDYFKIIGNISSQFISGLLMALPLLSDDSIIEVIPPIESKSYIDITIVVMEQFGVKISKKQESYLIKGNAKYHKVDTIVEGDYSNAAFLDSFNWIGGCVRLTGLNNNSIQGDKVYPEYFDKIKNDYCNIDLSDCIDLGPILFVMASIFNGAHFINTKRLAIKESNRINDVLEELAKFGLKYLINDNEVFIYKSILNKPIEVLLSHNDHRIVMALTIICSIYGGVIDNAEAVNKSFPSFFDVIKKLGVEVIDDIR